MFNIDQITNQTTVITPNRRLAATLHQFYQKYQLEQGNKAWQTPDILPMINWIERLWHAYTQREFSPIPLLLNPIQEKFLWEDILQSSQENTCILQISATADLITSAKDLLIQWQINIDHPSFQLTDEYKALHRWILTFNQICAEKNFIDRASIGDKIITLMKANKILPPPDIMLLGFTELSPQLQNLIQTCQTYGSQINYAHVIKQQNKVFRIHLEDSEDEIVTMARFAKATWKNNINARVGCVIPSLDKIRDRVIQIFSEIFADEDTYAIDMQASPFNISAGKSLASYPVIKTALLLLSLYRHTLPIELFSYLLTSPFLGESEKEAFKRAQFDTLLKKNNFNIIQLNKLLQANSTDNKHSFSDYCPYFSKRIKQLLSDIPHQKSEHSFQEWANRFNRWLTILGWPGERSLNSEEYQTVENWLKLLNDYTALDHVSSAVSLDQAIELLQKMANFQTFQPKTPQSPIQVLGLLEAASLPFDFLWVSGMDDLAWPPQAKPNPFIPKQLQRELQMPHATAERELSYCEQLTQQFKQSANQVIFSHAQKKEEFDLLPSSLIMAFPEINKDSLQLHNDEIISKRIYKAKDIELCIVDKAPMVTDDEIIRGGVNIIKQQAACPFKAFALSRLHAVEIEKPLLGLRHKERGIIIHMLMEKLWQELKNHATLVATSDHDLKCLIENVITTILDQLTQNYHNNPHYISLEKRRLHKLIYDWLQVEKNRQPFEVIDKEKIAQITLDQLKLTFKIDRIDQLYDGKYLIIDYKTGKQNDINCWFSERPDEPQLPLYSILDKTNTIGITFAQLYPGSLGFKGMSQYSTEIDGIKIMSEVKKTEALSWHEQLSQWENLLTRLGKDFYQGIVDVDPKHGEQTCMWCALKPLCRISECQ